MKVKKDFILFVTTVLAHDPACEVVKKAILSSLEPHDELVLARNCWSVWTLLLCFFKQWQEWPLQDLCGQQPELHDSKIVGCNLALCKAQPKLVDTCLMGAVFA
jgi:hypothetical protein